MKVCIMGLGAFGGGAGAARHFANEGHEVVVSDLNNRDALADSIRSLKQFSNIRFSLGGHCSEDILGADLLIVNPAVPDNQPLFLKARESNIPWTTECQVFLENTRAKVVAITGSLGKTTTAILTGDIIGAHHSGRVVVGGNIGGSLLDDLDELDEGDIVVLEVSSFQLARLETMSPGRIIAGCITNLSPDHDERHGGFEGYVNAKMNLLGLIAEDGTLVTGHPMPKSASDTINAASISRHTVTESSLTDEYRNALTLRGSCAEANAALAIALAAAALGKLDTKLVIEGLQRHSGLEHRLEELGEVAGIMFFNDSKSTTPTATAAAIQTLADAGHRIHVIVGGAQKGIGVDAILEAAPSCISVACMGSDGQERFAALSRSGSVTSFHKDLAEALNAVTKRAKAGETILFSPGHASYDAFADYRERGQAFKELVLGTTEGTNYLSNGIISDPGRSFCSGSEECYH